MLSAVKMALGITIDDLDADIQATIDSARAELIRSGITAEKALSDDDALITQAIKTYCRSIYTSDIVKSDKLMSSFKYQQECIRKSKGYSDV